MPARDRANALRQHMAYEAARIMVEQDVADFERARRKAAERTGILDRRNWPSNELIQEAVLAQRRLFSGPEQQDDLERMRRGALEAMRTFERFSPDWWATPSRGREARSRGCRSACSRSGRKTWCSP